MANGHNPSAIGDKRLNRVNIILSDDDMKKARSLGSGSISAGAHVYFSDFFLKKDLKTTPLPTCSRGNQLAGLAIFSVVTVAMLGI